MASKNLLRKFRTTEARKGVKRHTVKGQNAMLHMLYDIGAMGLLGHKVNEYSKA